MMARQLAAVDAGYRSPATDRFRGAAGASVFLARRGAGSLSACPLIIEMKVDSEEMARATVEVVRAAGALDRVCLGSFGRRVLEAARSYEPVSQPALRAPRRASRCTGRGSDGQ